jgi:hypothetical protein
MEEKKPNIVDILMDFHKQLKESDIDVSKMTREEFR